MADIKVNESEDRVVFLAIGLAAQDWMRRQFDKESVVFRLPDQQILALEFTRAAYERGFKIEVRWDSDFFDDKTEQCAG